MLGFPKELFNIWNQKHGTPAAMVSDTSSQWGCRSWSRTCSSAPCCETPTKLLRPRSQYLLKPTPALRVTESNIPLTLMVPNFCSSPATLRLQTQVFQSHVGRSHREAAASSGQSHHPEPHGNRQSWNTSGLPRPSWATSPPLLSLTSAHNTQQRDENQVLSLQKFLKLLLLDKVQYPALRTQMQPEHLPDTKLAVSACRLPLSPAGRGFLAAVGRVEWWYRASMSKPQRACRPESSCHLSSSHLEMRETKEHLAIPVASDSCRAWKAQCPPKHEFGPGCSRPGARRLSEKRFMWGF